jgi:hypothetical protein
VAVILAVAPAAPIPKDAQKDVLYYPTTKGTTWTYSAKTPTRAASEFTEFVTEVQKKDDGAFVVTVGRQFKDRVTLIQKVEVTGKGLSRVASGAPLNPPRVLLKVGAKVGDTWEHNPVPGHVLVRPRGRPSEEGHPGRQRRAGRGVEVVRPGQGLTGAGRSDRRG